MQYTQNYNFDLPEENDEMETATRTALDDNFTDLDTLLKDIEDDISDLGAKTGNDIPFESGSADSISDKINILSNFVGDLSNLLTTAKDSIVTAINEIVGKLGVDWIVEQGTSGDWTYRKWSSGNAELWLHNYKITTTPTQSPQGNLYQELYAVNKNFPFSFIEAPFAIGNNASSDAHGIIQSITTNTTKITYIHTYRGSSGSYNMWINIYVMGKWK